MDGVSNMHEHDLKSFNDKLESLIKYRSSMEYSSMFKPGKAYKKIVLYAGKGMKVENAEGGGEIDFWRNPEDWTNFLDGNGEGSVGLEKKKKTFAPFNLDMYIRSVMSSLLSFLANPKCSKGGGSKGVSVTMQDIHYYCRMLPPSIRVPFIKRIEQMLNNSGLSVKTTSSAVFNAGALAQLFAPITTPTTSK